MFVYVMCLQLWVWGEIFIIGVATPQVMCHIDTYMLYPCPKVDSGDLALLIDGCTYLPLCCF